MSPDQLQQLEASSTIFILVTVVVALVVAILSLVIYWRIFSKAGYSGALGLLMFIPLANIIVICVLAFGEWPIYRELNQLRQQANAMRGQPYPQAYPRNR